MSHPHSAPGPRPGAPSPATMAADAARLAGELGDPADHPVTGEVQAILAEFAMIRETVGEEFDLGALSRQADLLSAAHDKLSRALEEVGRG